MSNRADPRVVWDALAARDYRPHGKPGDFRSRCPAHDGDNPESLHITLSEDGTILLHCFAYGCKAEEIVERIGLRMADLFPSDHRYSARLRPARREDFSGNLRIAANVMLAAQKLAVPIPMEVKLPECPCCESQHVSIVFPPTGEPFAHCPRGCGVNAMTGALAEQLTQRRLGRG